MDFGNSTMVPKVGADAPKACHYMHTRGVSGDALENLECTEWTLSFANRGRCFVFGITRGKNEKNILLRLLQVR